MKWVILGFLALNILLAIFVLPRPGQQPASPDPKAQSTRQEEIAQLKKFLGEHKPSAKERTWEKEFLKSRGPSQEELASMRELFAKTTPPTAEKLSQLSAFFAENKQKNPETVAREATLQIERAQVQMTEARRALDAKGTN